MVVKKKVVKKVAPVATKPPSAAEVKAKAFTDYAEGFGWMASIEIVDEETLRATATKEDKRYDESIVVTWLNGRVPDTNAGGVTYTVNKRTLLLRNVSAARQHIDGTKKVNRDLAPRQTRRVTTIGGEPVERDTREESDLVQDQGIISGMYRVIFSDGRVKYRKSLGTGYKVHSGAEADCPGCKVFGCQETRPGAWDGPPVVVKKVVKKKIIKRKVAS